MQSCRSGFRDDGAICTATSCPAGYAPSSPGFCTENEPSGYECVGIGCRKLCPSGWTNDGLTCRKATGCTNPNYPDHEGIVGAGWCYQSARSGYSCSGPTCIQSSCPSGYQNRALDCWR